MYFFSLCVVLAVRRDLKIIYFFLILFFQQRLSGSEFILMQTGCVPNAKSQIHKENIVDCSFNQVKTETHKRSSQILHFNICLPVTRGIHQVLSQLGLGEIYNEYLWYKLELWVLKDIGSYRYGESYT